MQTISDRFRVNAPLEAVAFFHRDTRALKLLTPPPILVQIHRTEPLANGSLSEFTLWFVPLPVRWLAVHSQVDPQSGFTDIQMRGPMKYWEHSHHWEPVGPAATMMEEKIRFEYPSGLQGIFARIMFALPLLKLMLLYRKWVIRRSAER